MTPAPPPVRRFVHLPSVDSTSSELRRRVAAGDAEPGLVLSADEQTAGRGRRGATWTTVAGRSLAVSLLADAPALERPARVTLLCAVATARALEAAGAPELAIKWPNDLYRGERKLGGILVEPVRDPSGVEHLVIGVGVNLTLRPGDLPDALNELAGDAGVPADDASRAALLRRIVAEIDAALAEIGTPADAARGEEFRRRSWLTGRLVDLVHAGRHERVRVDDVTAAGDLLTADGRLLRGEHVQLAPRAPR
ncbi:MAG: biotin--[acetyl-CoA-carboxylase] ligase [Planctomycetes bacterium]|nr:biotin--[acetyl-CoA-carboxylase] ligase [Planctomycetota bacterium]